METGQSLSLLVDWTSVDSHVLLNPKWPEDSLDLLKRLEKKYSKPSHIWISSSGSSSTSSTSVKLLALSKKAILASAQAVNKHLSSTAKDVWLQSLPEFHVGGLGIYARAFLSGAKIIHGTDWEQATLGALVPTQIFDLVQQKKKAPKNLRAVIVGGAAISDELYNQALDLGWPLLPSYGLTECCSQVATARLEGLASRDRSLHLLGHIQAKTEYGLLQIQSPALLTGYAQSVKLEDKWTDPKFSGWLTTEDRVEISGNILKVFGRNSDFVKISGEGVNLSGLQQTLESCLQSAAAKNTFDFAIAAIPDERRGHSVVLVCSAAISSELSNKISSEFNARVAPYERITAIKTVEQIPRTELGKIARTQLLALL